MSLMSYFELVELVKGGVINAPTENINGASIDVTLGTDILVEHINSKIIDLSAKEAPNLIKKNIADGEHIIYPGEFILAHTAEVFNLPSTVACEFKLKSSLARAGLGHALAGWADPTWHGSVLTLELFNSLRHHPLKLKSGMKIGQMVFFRCNAVPKEYSYALKGQYNQDQTVSGSKGVR